MKIRPLRRTLSIGGLCLLAALASTAQTRRSLREPGAKHDRPAVSGLSAVTIASLSKATAVTLPWFDDMENGASGWTSTGFWHLPYRPQQTSVLSPTINPNLVTLPDAGNLPSPFSGNYCWWYGQNATGTFIGVGFNPEQSPKSGGTSDSANSGDLITPPISLVGQTHAVLSFQTWWEIEGVESNSFDVMSIDASTNAGVTWVPLGRGQLNPLSDPSGAHFQPFSSNGLGQKGSWTKQYFDLSADSGKVVLIRFNFDTGDALYNGFRGWFIDDVGVTAGSLPAPEIALVAPPVVNPSVTQVMSIIGANFVSGATIRVDNATVTGGVLNSNLAQFDPTGLVVGGHNVTITNPDGQTATRVKAFVVTLATPPIFTSVAPDSAPSGVGVPITITGNHFRPGVSVSIGGVTAPVQQLFDSTRIVARSPTTLPIGTYNIIVVNPDSLSDIGVLGFNVTPLVYNTGDSLIGKPQPLRIATVDSVYTSGELYYRLAGKTAYDSVALTGSFGHFSVTLPAAAVTIRGVEYYLTLVTLQGVRLSFPGLTPSLTPSFLPVRVQRVFPPTPPTAAHYKMFSSPMILDNSLVMGQLGDDYGAYNPAQWRVFRWVRNGYRELGSSAGLYLDPGNAFWVITSSGTPFSLKRGVSVPSGQSYPVPVDTGWNQIANPFGFNVAWSQVVGVEGSGFMTGPYAYDGTQYKIAPVLEPYEGYFVYNGTQQPASLLFPPVETTLAALHKEGRFATAPGPGEFILQLSAALPGTEFRDTYNYIGFRTGASSGRDKLDAPKPPPIGDGLHLNILDGGIPYLENYKSASGEGASWVIDLDATGTKGKAVLTLTPSGTLPAGYSLHVLDLVNENAVPAASGSFEVNLDAPNAPRYFKVIMGTEAYASDESQGIPLQPVSYALEQNYPNPFNPATTIRYSLAKKSQVVLEIYNTLGQRVRTLSSGVQSTGEYSLVWDGSSDTGGHVASGVYFYRLRAGEYSAVRKLVMIR